MVDKPEEVLLWQATNRKSHDFRLPIFGQHWTSSKLSDQGDGVYRAEISPPATGATAAFIELRYKVNNKPLKFTTSAAVLPKVP